MATGKYINPDRMSKIQLGLKAEKKHHVITHNPSAANPGAILYVRIPNLTKNTVFVPDSLYLSADLEISGKTGHDNHVVNNVGRNIISKFEVKIGTNTAFNLSNYDIYMTYKDLWLSKHKRKNMVFEGIQDEEVRKLRSGLTVSSAGANNKMLFKVFAKKYKIPLDFELLTDHGPLYKYAINEDIIFEITLATNDRILVSTDTKDWGYKLSNICLEYDTVTSESIANSMLQKYNSGYNVLYDMVDHFKTVSIKANDTLINENINFPRRSIKGVDFIVCENFYRWTKK